MCFATRRLRHFSFSTEFGTDPEIVEPACVTIQDGALYATTGELLETGYDMWGYNYQAHMFNGMYCDYLRGTWPTCPYVEDELIMKWNEAWISNQDCDGDGKLDRHFGHDSYIGSGAWTTNHQNGTYPDPLKPTKSCRWSYFVKIIAVPTDAELLNGVWRDGSGDEIGPVIWGEFAIIQQVYNDPCGGFNGLEYKGARPGLGGWGDPDESP
jgi:hypothetical protein